MKLGQNVNLDEIMKMGDVSLKTRSLGQIFKKPCVQSRGHIFSHILMKLSQTVCPDEILDEFKDGSAQKLGHSVKFRKT